MDRDEWMRRYMADTNLADDDYRIIAREALAGKAEQ